MILESKTDTLILEEGEVQNSTKMAIDEDSHIFLMRMLSKFYSDGVGSPIRETASNALDSHRASDITDPIIVNFIKNKDGNYEFSVEDFGCGLDSSDVENIISKYGKSTKRLSTNQLGAFGLGFKSPMAYSSSFYFIGRKNGIERKWMMYESDDESNKIDLLYESETTERNGVKVVVPVKYTDREEFRRKISEQLAYFESVYFNVQYEYGSIFKNEDVKIFRAEDFQWSSLCKDSYLHICLDNVYYPIDWDKLGVSPINFPVGLRFSLMDNIFPIPNREQLKYTKEAKDIIIAKIKKVANYFVDKYNESMKETEDVSVIVNYFRNHDKYVSHPSGKDKICINSLIMYSRAGVKEPVLKGIKYLSMKRIYELKDYFFKEYTPKYKYYNNRFTDAKNNYRDRLDEREVYNHPEMIYIFDELVGLKKTYLRDTLDYRQRFFVKKDKVFRLGNIKDKYSTKFDNYYSTLNLWNHPKSEWRDRIKEFQYITSLVVSKFQDVNKIEVPEEWLNARKEDRLSKLAATKARKAQILEGDIPGKVAYSLDRYSSKTNCKFIQESIPLKNAYKKEYLIIYGGNNNVDLMQRLFNIINKSRIRLVIFTQKELKNLEEIQLHNWIEISKFMEGKNITFKRLVTSYLINELHNEYNNTFDRIIHLKKICAPLADKLNKLDSYRKEYYQDGEDNLYKEMLKVAEEYKLFDLSVYGIYNEVKNTLKKLPFIEPMCGTLGWREDDSTQPILHAIRDLFKYYKQRIDWQHYNLPITEEIEVINEKIEEITENQEENEITEFAMV